MNGSAALDYQLADLDQQLADAHTRLRAARAACQRSPNAKTIAAVHDAVGRCDELLDRRLVIRPRQAGPGS